MNLNKIEKSNNQIIKCKRTLNQNQRILKSVINPSKDEFDNHPQFNIQKNK